MHRDSHPAAAQRKTAIVTGGSRGIGLELTRILRLDHNVFSFDKSEPHLRLQGIHHIKCDITSPDDVLTSLAFLPKPITLLVNNAGIIRDGSVTDAREPNVADLVNVNLIGSWRMIKEAWKYMASDATILQISSLRAYSSREAVDMYGVTKKAVEDMALRLHRSHPEKRVKIAYPGPVDTPMLANFLEKERLRQLSDVIIDPKKLARHISQLLDSEFQILKFYDSRDMGHRKGKGFYRLEYFEGEGHHQGMTLGL